MPFVYAIALPTTTSLTTSGTTNTESDAMMVAAGSGRTNWLRKILVHGKANALTSISAITFKLKKFTTASSGGTSITPVPMDVGAQAAKCTAAYSPTAGSGDGAVRATFGCGAGGPGGFVAEDRDAAPVLESGSGDSHDVFSQAIATSLAFDISMYVEE